MWFGASVDPDPPSGAADLESWVAPHLPVLVALAERQVGRGAAGDVVQETLIRAWRRRATFQPERGSARAWLIAIMLDQARRHRLRRRPAYLSPHASVQPPDGSRLDMERAIRQLSRRQREVVTLHYLADLPVSEVGAVLGITPSAVKAHLFAARAKLRALLEEPR